MGRSPDCQSTDKRIRKTNALPEVGRPLSTRSKSGINPFVDVNLTAGEVWGANYYSAHNLLVFPSLVYRNELATMIP